MERRRKGGGREAIGGGQCMSMSPMQRPEHSDCLPPSETEVCPGYSTKLDPDGGARDDAKGVCMCRAVCGRGWCECGTRVVQGWYKGRYEDGARVAVTSGHGGAYGMRANSSGMSGTYSRILPESTSMTWFLYSG